ncbi:mitochondrial uncoupling protein 2-like isoform X12 [Catharus ustulatus]|uniref:mitochondrial uncoupling protein 2-like isoform X12 n=1 Tax=Catharus ustulatus TaxID=91951 RepID=UPI001C5B90B8|nr:mitochondrial uncoupling protein 2-like isoform X12 [Catharus ustulatus]
MEIIKAKKEVVLMRTVLRVYQHKLAQKETCESFPDDSSEDPVEGSESSIKPKIPLSDPVVVPNFFLPPQEMEASMRLLSTSSHPSASPEGCRSALEPGRKTRQEPAGEECRCQAALSGARGLEQRWLQGVRSTGSRSCASPSATMVGLKPPEVPPTITMKFISAGMAGCIADLCTFPLDTAKVRLQIQGEVRIPRTISSVEYRGVLGTLSTMVRTEGARSLYRGLAAGLQRQMGFSSISIGLYDPVKQLYTPKGAERTLPNIARNVIINCGELVTYDIIKDALLRAQLMADNVPCHFVAAFGAGFCATVVASPVDVVKTRYMNSSPGQYSNVLSCLLALLTQDGPAGLYKGFVPSFLRLGSWNVVMFVSYEQLQRAMALARPGLA